MDAPMMGTLPIRLLPRKRLQILLPVLSVCFLAFSLIWIVGSSLPGVPLKFNGVEVTDPAARAWFPLFGVPFLLFGGLLLAGSTFKMLPRSPYFHIDLSTDGLSIREWRKRRTYAWRDLPAFETLEVVNEDDDGKSIRHYTVAMEALSAPADLKPGETYQREVVRIAAEDYAATNDRQGAADLAAWLNQLRASAQQNRLRAGEPIQVPEAFRRNTLSMAGSANRTSTVIKR